MDSTIIVVTPIHCIICTLHINFLPTFDDEDIYPEWNCKNTFTPICNPLALLGTELRTAICNVSGFFLKFIPAELSHLDIWFPAYFQWCFYCYKGLWRTLFFFPYWTSEKATRIVFLLVCGRELVFSTTHILIRVASQPSSMEQKNKVHRRPL